MNRRDFNRRVIAAMAVMATPRAVPASQPLRVNGQRVNGWLDTLSTFGRNSLGGVSRPAYGDADLEARDFVLRLLRDAGMETSIDAAGNLVGRMPGSEAGLLPIGTGSHIDSVPEGGRYDGTVGTMGAIEVAMTLRDAGRTLRHPLELIVFQNEENGKVGSKALRGEDPASYMDFVTNSGLTVRDGITRIGGDPARIEEVVRAEASMAAFVELHIEQGAVLESAGIDVGVVEGIVGIRRWNVEVQGFANHAGTTPMDRRQDALLAAARLVDAVNRTVRERPGRHVGTVGSLRAEPGVANVIAGRAQLTIELRDLAMGVIQPLIEEIEEQARNIALETGTSFEFRPVYRTEPATCSEMIRGLIDAQAKELGFTTLSLPSGAGHDAQEMALLGPIGMIFVPSRGGISHSADEYTEPAHIEAGANVLLHTLLALDARLDA
jgi:N-carbamoyl-L-amino-acid hydrolase